MAYKEERFMLIMTAKLSKKKIIIATAAICLAVGSLFFLKGGESDVNAANMDDAATRLEYIESLGWQVEEGEFMEVNIPEEFDQIYSAYNDLQVSQGMDLSDYKGQRAMHYSYTIKNYPTGEEGVQLCLVVHDGKVIAGDVSSPKLESFMHGLEMPKSESTTSP